MADNSKKPDNNLIDLASERRRFQQQQKASKTKVPYGNQHQKKPGHKSNKPRWYHYVQLIVFLAVLGVMMTLCQGQI